MSHTKTNSDINSLTDTKQYSEKDKQNLEPSLDISGTIWSRREKHKNHNHPFVCILYKSTEENREITEESLIIQGGDTSLTTPQIYALHIDEAEKTLLNTPQRRYKDIPLTPNLTHFNTRKDTTKNNQKKAESNKKPSAQALNPLPIIGNSLEVELNKSPNDITPIQDIKRVKNKHLIPSLTILSPPSTIMRNLHFITPDRIINPKKHEHKSKICCNIFRSKLKKHRYNQKNNKYLET